LVTLKSLNPNLPIFKIEISRLAASLEGLKSSVPFDWRVMAGYVRAKTAKIGFAVLSGKKLKNCK